MKMTATGVAKPLPASDHINPEVKSHADDPAFIEKKQRMEELLKKYGLPSHHPKK